MSDPVVLKKARDVLAANAKAVENLSYTLTNDIIKVVDLMFGCEGHILVTGAGTSRAVALRFAHLLACCGTPALFINAADALHGGAGCIKKEDVIFVISKGGKSREINTFVEIAKKRGARIIAQTENPDSPLGHMSDAIYHVATLEEVDPYDMIATGSSLVNAAAGNVLCEILLERRRYSQDDFGATHPEGAVGKKLRDYRQNEK